MNNYKPDLSELVDKIKEAKLSYDYALESKIVRRERKKLKNEYNKLVDRFNSYVKFKALKSL